MSTEKKQAEPPCAADDEECQLEDLERDLATEEHVPLDGAPSEHWKHVDAPLTEEERLGFQAAKEEHQARMARGRPRGKL